MIKKFLYLEWKSFLRSASFGTNLALKIVIGVFAFFYAIMFLFMGIGVYYGLEEEGFNPLTEVNRFLIYYLLFDLIIKLIFQKIPVLNIRPLLNLPITRKTIVSFSMGKTCISFFNWIHLLFLVPFTVVLCLEGNTLVASLLWFVSIVSIIYINNFLNIMLSNKDNLFYGFMLATAILGYLHFAGIFDITVYTLPIFQSFFDYPVLALVPILILVGLIYQTYLYLKSNLYLDTGLKIKQSDIDTQNLTWLDQYGKLGSFLKNDIRMIKRNKRSKTTISMSIMFIFYGLFFFTGIVDSYDNPMMHMFAGIFVTGGFLFTFGQFVPSWDSSYYPLMMTQNISYKEYLESKWWLIVIATIASTVVASFYIYFGWQIYLIIIASAIYNIGVNSHLVLLGGAYVKTPIDLNTTKGAFGDKKAFNVKTLLVSIPKMIIPMILYGIGYYFFQPEIGILFVAIAGVIGFVLRNKVFQMIEKIYKTQKYDTISSYKQKN